MTFSFAETATLPQLCSLFNAAFSDYVIPMVLTVPVLEMKLLRDGMNPAMSPLAMEQTEPVGLILNSLGIWHGKKTAYNGGTGVVPSARGKATTQQMYQFILPLLQQQGVEQCLLEVIQENKRAWAIYERLGFETVRALRCFRHAKADFEWHAHTPAKVELHAVPFPDWPLYQTFWDMEPSWQHHTAAIDRSSAYVQIVEAHVSGQCVGYGIVYRMTGSVAQLAVAPSWRNKGIGQALMQHLISLTEAPAITVVNVEDGKGESLLRFLARRKMAETKGQYEMVWEV